MVAVTEGTRLFCTVKGREGCLGMHAVAVAGVGVKEWGMLECAMMGMLVGMVVGMAQRGWHPLMVIQTRVIQVLQGEVYCHWVVVTMYGSGALCHP